MAILPVTRVSAGDNLVVSQPSIKNLASSVAPKGIAPPLIGGGIVSAADLISNSLDFPLSSFQLTPVASAVRFVFSGAIVQPKITLGVQTYYGVPAITKGADSIQPVGIAQPVISAPLLLPDGYSETDFNLNSEISDNNSLNISFHFGPIVIANVSAGNNYSAGTPKLINALNIRSIGMSATSNNMKAPFIYVVGEHVGKIDFELALPMQVSASNVRFTFGGASPITQAGAINQQVTGQPSIKNASDAINTTSLTSGKTGTPLIYPATSADINTTYGFLNFNLDRQVQPQNALNIPFSFFGDIQLSVIGFSSSKFGSTVLINKTTIVNASSWQSSKYGNSIVFNHTKILSLAGIASNSDPSIPTIVNSAKSISVPSFLSDRFGSSVIINKSPNLSVTGIPSPAFNAPTIWFRNQYLTAQPLESLVFGSLTVTHGVREVIASGANSETYGTHWVSRGTRLLEPTSIYADLPSNHYVGRHQEIKPQGYIATLFGTRIIPDILSVYPLGFTGVFGQTTTYLQTQYLKPKGYLSAGEQPAFRWGRHIAYNSDQYINQYYIGDSGLVPPKWSDYQSIENRNKTIGAIGTPMQKHGYTTIAYGARILEVKGLAATQFSPNMIAYRVRALPLPSIEPPAMSDYYIVHNAARVIAANGFDSLKVGTSSIETNRRYLDRIGRIESFESGTPMISYRIRTLDIEKRYSIAPPIIRLPTVDLHTRYVDFNGYETAKYGLASLSIHFSIITPRWTHNEKSGSPALRNVTPELLARGHDSQEHGNASIRTQWRNVYAQGDDSSAIGLLKISDTKQHISVRGFLDSLASQKHTVTKTSSAPYSLQYIWLHDEDGSNQGEGYGIAPPKMLDPSLNQNVLYHHSKDISSRFGTQFVWSNNITVFGGIAIDGVSKALTVSNKNNIIGVKGIDNHVDSKRMGKPRLSPHTIYAVMEAPQQAKDNQPAIKDLHYVGGMYRGGYTVGEVFGNAFVESSIRHLYTYGNGLPSSVMGRPSIELSRKLIKPNGISLGRFGVPAIPFTLQSIGLRDGIYASTFGSVKLVRPPYTGPQYISTKDFYSTAFGNPYSDNFVRTLSAIGTDSLSMGLSKPNDNPFMWQGLRIGEQVPLIIGGGDMSSYGDASISLRVRDIAAKGFNAFISEYTLSAFDGRMTVSNADKQLPAISNIAVSGIESNNIIGYQDIKLGQHYIRPDGNSDQFRKGGYHA